jgi:hypothetical protein
LAAFDSSIVWTIEREIYFAIWVILFGVKLFALCDAAFRPNQVYVAADKQTKVIWIAMLGVTMLLHIFDTRTSFGLLSLIGAVVALVYLADVRPTLKSMQSRCPSPACRSSKVPTVPSSTW